MIIAGIAIFLVLIVVGVFLSVDGNLDRNSFEASAGYFMLLLAGWLIALTMVMSGSFGNFHYNDHDDCVQLVWLDDKWNCVPEEQAG